MKEPTNRHPNRESWLNAALNDLRGHFAAEGFVIPPAVRVAIGFPSTGRRNKQVGECWDESTSADRSWEIFIRPDLAEPVAVLSVLTAKAIHTVIPSQSGLGKAYKAAAIKIGMQGKMRAPEPGALLLEKLQHLAASLGPLPHASLSITDGPKIRRAVDGKKKQGTRLLKATCGATGCGYTVRLAGQWVRDVGPPHCPKHGPMGVEQPPENDEIEAPETEEIAAES